MKTEWLKIRASRANLDTLHALAAKLEQDVSTTVWALVHEKDREVAYQAAVVALASAKGKKRLPVAG